MSIVGILAALAYLVMHPPNGRTTNRQRDDGRSR
jgi:hypothetical protein